MISSLIRSFNGSTVKEIPTTYLEFSSSTPMTIKPIYTNSGVLLQYKIDGGQWKNISSGVTTPSANVIYFRGVATGTKSLYSVSNSAYAWVFTGATNLECIGNINSLIQDVLGGDVLDIKLGDYCYGYMFYGCKSLTTAPTLPSTTINFCCYEGMLSGCSSLTVAPTLPATTLAQYCYQRMFSGCTSLTVVPTLPATTLTGYCYKEMFRNCTNSKVSTTKTGEYQTEYRIPPTGTGKLSTDSLTDMFLNTGGTFKGTPNINTIYYTANIIV